MRAAQAAYVKAVERNDAVGMISTNRDFHLAIAEAAGNPFLLSISTLIEVALDAMLRVSSPVESPARLTQSLVQHKAIISAIAARKPEGARKAMQVVVNAKTVDIDKNVNTATDEATKAQLQGQASKLGKTQGEIKDIANKIMEQMQQ